MRRYPCHLLASLGAGVLLVVAAGCQIGVFYENKPEIYITPMLPDADPVAVPADAKELAPATAEARPGGEMGDLKSTKRLNGQYVINCEITGCPAGTGYSLPFDILRGILQNAGQGAAIPVGQSPVINQSGTQQQYNNQTATPVPDQKPKTDK